MEITEQLRTFMEEGKDWERKPTNVKGVTIIRLPKTKNRPASLAIDFNPVNEHGVPMKKKGIMIMNGAELSGFRAAVNNEKVDNLLKALEEVIPERKAAAAQAKPPVLEL